MNIICIDQDSQTYVECPETNYCTLTVNNVEHGKFSFVNVDIPSEIARDYTGDNLSDSWIHNQFNLTVSWYNVDNEYIESIISQEKITPTNEDIEYFFTWLANYIPLIFVWFFIILVWRIIKRSFK